MPYAIAQGYRILHELPENSEQALCGLAPQRGWRARFDLRPMGPRAPHLCTKCITRSRTVYKSQAERSKETAARRLAALRFRYGVDGDRIQTWKATGSYLGVSRERARQIAYGGIREMVRLLPDESAGDLRDAYVAADDHQMRRILIRHSDLLPTLKREEELLK